MVRVNRRVLLSLFFVSMMTSAQASLPEISFSEVMGGFGRSLFWETKGFVQTGSDLQGSPIYEPVVIQPMLPLPDLGRKARSFWNYFRGTPKSTIAKALIEDVDTHLLKRVGLVCFLIGEETHAAVMVASYGASSLSSLKQFFGIGSDLLTSFRKGSPISDRAMQGLVMLAATTILIPSVEAFNSNTCDLPLGSYQLSCTQSSATLLKSTDRNIQGPMCSLVTLCRTMYDGLPLKRNSFMYEQGDRVELGNNNGTLVLISKIAGARPSLTECKLPEGSYKQTCHVSIEPYISSDRSLASSNMCQLSADCRTLGWRSNYQRRVIQPYQLGRLENCNGVLVHHLVSSLDGSCNGKAVETIRRIAEWHKRDEL